MGLLEPSMAKLEAELDPHGLKLEVDELCREAVTAQNATLNYGGATPAMAVFGALPRPFFQGNTDQVAAFTGALQTDVTFHFLFRKRRPGSPGFLALPRTH